MKENKTPKYKSEQIMIVFRGTPTCEDGGVVQIIDRDVTTCTYLVSFLQEVGMAKFDAITLRERMSRWVNEDDMIPVSFEKPALKPKTLIQRLKDLFDRLKAKI